MSSQEWPPGSFDLGSVKVWYECRKRGVNCSAIFHSVPALQKHFAEKHPGVECKGLENFSPEVMQGKVTFWNEEEPKKGFSQGDNKREVLEPQAGPSKSKITCPICSKHVESWDKLSSHLKKEHPNPCHTASGKLNNPGGVTARKSHRRSVPTGRGKRQSLQKGSKPRKVIKKKRSSVSSASTSHFQCPRCSKTFGNCYNLKRHLVTHSGVRPYKCEICGVTKSLMEGFVGHLKLVHNILEEDAKKMASEAGLQFLQTKKKLEGIDRSKINSAVITSIVEKTDITQASTSGSVTEKSNKPETKPSDNKKRGEMTTCPHCPYETKAAKLFVNHLKLHEEGFEAKVCPLCGWYVNPFRTVMSTHLRVRHNAEPRSSSRNK